MDQAAFTHMILRLRTDGSQAQLMTIMDIDLELLRRILGLEGAGV